MSQGYLGGAYLTTKLSADNTAGGVVVSIDPQVTAKYAYSGQLCARGYVLKINLQSAAPCVSHARRQAGACVLRRNVRHGLRRMGTTTRRQRRCR